MFTIYNIYICPTHGFNLSPDPHFSTVYNFGSPDPLISFSIKPPAMPPITGARAAARRGKIPP